MHYITLSSADTSNPGLGTPAGNSRFTNAFERPLIFDASHEWEIALFSISINLTTAWAPATSGSVYVYSSLVAPTQIVGSATTNLLRRVFFDDVGRQDVEFSNLKFVPLSASVFGTAEVQLLDATGATVPVEALQGSTLTMVIRKKPFS